MKTTSIFNYISFVLLSLVFSLEAFSQRAVDNLGRVPSPQAADLGRFGDIPVSYYTGRANVTIPIQSFTERGVTLNINLSYDTAGPMMNQLPGWVGPGWTLNAGGCITRVQNGTCDEVTYDSYFTYSNMFYNYFHSYSDLMLGGGNFNRDVVNDPSLFCWHDYDPDLFYFNFMGKTGCFFLGNDGTWKVRSDHNLVVEFDYNDQTNFGSPVFSTTSGMTESRTRLSQSQAIRGFVIYDDGGNKYTFGYTPESVEYSIDLFKTTSNDIESSWIATSWYLTKIEDRFGNELFQLHYSRGKFLVQLYYQSYSEEMSAESEGNSLLFHVSSFNSHSTSFTGYSGTLNSPSYLTEIVTRGGKNILFQMSPVYGEGETSRHIYASAYNEDGSPKVLVPVSTGQPQYWFYYLQCPGENGDNSQYWSTLSGTHQDPLSAIELQNLTKISIKSGNLAGSISYELHYDSIGRNHLKEVVVCGNHTPKGTYTLDYYDYSQIPSDYLTTKHDTWGYYSSSGITNESSMALLQEENRILWLNYYLPKTLNTFTPAGLLKEIGYPTGGKSVLEYEGNSYSSRLSFDRQTMIPELGFAGGARVKTITDYPGSYGTAIKKRTFSYLDSSGKSSGQLFAAPTFQWTWEETGEWEYKNRKCGFSINVQVSQSIPSLPLFTAAGVHVGYSDIKESFSDSTVHEYHYSNFSDVKDDSVTYRLHIPRTTNPFTRFGDLSFMRGRLLSEIIRDASGIINKKVAYVYRTDEDEYRNKFSYGSNFIAYSDAFANASIYKIYYHKFDLEKVITSTRQGDTMINDTTGYSMSDYTAIGNLPAYFRKCASETRVRGNDYVKKIFSYTPIGNKYFFPMTSTATYHGAYLQEKDLTIYSVINGHEHPWLEIHSNTLGVNDTILRYNEYSSNGLPLKYTRKGEYPTRLYWDDKDRLRASVKSPHSDMTFQINPYADSPLYVLLKDGESLFKFPEVQARAYLYNERGLLSAAATDNGMVRKYEYDALDRLVNIKDGENRTIQAFSYKYSTGRNNFLDE